MSTAPMPPIAAAHAPADAQRLAAFVAAHPGLLVLTGAGVSTASGIADYRDAAGAWKKAQPIDYRDFVRDPAARQRYWARSLLGWPQFECARPNAAHRALRTLQQRERIGALLTQNVDGLHQRAGHRDVINLHGRLHRVVCLACGQRSARDALQARLSRDNAAFAALAAPSAPDGDALLEDVDFSAFTVPDCTACGGTLKPEVVFFGESVPAARVARAYAALAQASAMLVLGSSLMVFSGYRFVRQAVRDGKPVAAVNLGVTRADAELGLKLSAPCEQVLGQLCGALG